MGGAIKTVGRVAAGVATLGMSEVGRAAGKQVGKLIGGKVGKIIGTGTAAAIGAGGGASPGAGLPATAGSPQAYTDALKGQATVATMDNGDPTDTAAPSELKDASEFDMKKKRRAMRASTLLTGNRGVLGDAPVAAASLIGGGNKTLG